MLDTNECLTTLPEGKASDIMGETELKKIILNSISNGCGKYAYVQGFDL